MVKYLGKFSPSMADATVHLRQPLGKDCVWMWALEHDREFKILEGQIMSSTPTLISFRLGSETLLSTDASSLKLGAAIMQKVDGE